ncbi:MAG: hypothetical protein ACOC2C_03985 [Cyclonatronaceae bacterium]
MNSLFSTILQNRTVLLRGLSGFLLLFLLFWATPDMAAQKRVAAPSEPEPPSSPITPPSHTDPITDDPDSPYLLPDNPASVPIDGGASLLILAGAAGGALAIRRKKQLEKA